MFIYIFANLMSYWALCYIFHRSDKWVVKFYWLIDWFHLFSPAQKMHEIPANSILVCASVTHQQLNLSRDVFCCYFGFFIHHIKLQNDLTVQPSFIHHEQNHHYPPFIIDRQFRNLFLHMHQFSRCIYAQKSHIVYACVCWGWSVTVQTLLHTPAQQRCSKYRANGHISPVSAKPWNLPNGSSYESSSVTHTHNQERDCVKTGFPNLSQATDPLLDREMEQWLNLYSTKFMYLHILFLCLLFSHYNS